MIKIRLAACPHYSVFFGCSLFNKSKSLQFLYNAGNQEKLLLAKATTLLRRNQEATKADGVDGEKAYHYLVDPSKKKAKADFVCGKNIKTDAKIYKDRSSMFTDINTDDSIAHDAVLLIIYLKDDKKWVLLCKTLRGWRYWPANGHKRADKQVQTVNKLARVVGSLGKMDLWPSWINQ